MIGPKPGRPRLGSALKQPYTVSLDEEVAASLRAMGHGNLSAGITLAEYLARGMPRRWPEPIPVGALESPWIVFDLVDGPADPPRPGEILDPFRESLPLPPGYR